MKKKIAIIITTYNEENTIGRAIECALNQKTTFNYDVWVIGGGNDKSISIIKSFKNKINYLIEKKPEGKPNALNTIIPKVNADIVILTDGDVQLGPDVVNSITKILEKKNIGGCTGHVIPINDPTTLFGFFAKLSYNEMNERRKYEIKQNGSISFASGYIFGLKKQYFLPMPKYILADDGFISETLHKKNKRLSYSKKAHVFVQYPTSIRDFLIQKKRTRGGYIQLRMLFKNKLPIKRRSLSEEIRCFFINSFSYVHNIKDLVFLLSFFVLTSLSWILAFIDQLLLKKDSKLIWVPIKTTK